MNRPCSYSECSEYRIHHTRPNEPRGLQMVEVTDDYPLNDPVYCSYTCALLDGWMIMKYESPDETKTRQDKWRQDRIK